MPINVSAAVTIMLSNFRLDVPRSVRMIASVSVVDDQRLQGDKVTLRRAVLADIDAMVAMRAMPEVRQRWRGEDLAAEFIDDITAHNHHRISIDPAADNTAAIRCYTNVGFQPVGILRHYEFHRLVSIDCRQPSWWFSLSKSA